MGQFADLTTVKAFLGIPPADTSKDVVLNMLIASLDEQLLALFGLTSTTPTTYTDNIDIDDPHTDEVVTKRFPVLSVTSVTNRGNVLDAGIWSNDDRGYVKLLNDGATFIFGRNAVTIVYSAGFAGGVPPADLKHAAILMIASAYNTGPKAGLYSEQIGQYSYQLASGGLGNGGAAGGGFGIPPEAERILSNYRRTLVHWPN